MQTQHTQLPCPCSLVATVPGKGLALGQLHSSRQVLGMVWDLGQARDHLQQSFSCARPVLKAESLVLWALLIPCQLASLAAASWRGMYTVRCSTLVYQMCSRCCTERENDTATVRFRPGSRFRPRVLCWVSGVRLADLKHPEVSKN